MTRAIKTKVDFPGWFPLSSIHKVFNALEQHEGQARLVGGVVRDLLLGVENHDIDIAITLPAEQTSKILKNKVQHVIPTGIKYGTITAIDQEVKMELTTLREDIDCFGRDATVRFTSDWQVDAARRDFTINALYMDLEGNIYDYFDGLSDLSRKLVRYIGDPQQRIMEDHLRILRYFRFLSYLGLDNIDEPSLQCSIKLREKLTHISGERIREELYKIMARPYATSVIDLLQKHGILEVIFGTTLQQSQAFCAVTPEFDNRLNLLVLINLLKDADLAKIKARLKLSNDDWILLSLTHKFLYEYQDVPSYHKLWAYRKPHHYRQLLGIIAALGYSIDAQVPLSFAPKMPVHAHDLPLLHGAALGQELQRLEELWIKSDYSLTREELLKL